MADLGAAGGRSGRVGVLIVKIVGWRMVKIAGVALWSRIC